MESIPCACTHQSGMENKLLVLLVAALLTVEIRSDGGDPSPTPWPERFHALLYKNFTSTGLLQVTNMWYDWPRGRNVNLVQRQLGDLLHGVEWNNGTTYYYTLGPAGSGTCHVVEYGVGIPRPDWSVGSTYLGRSYVDGFLCHVWGKLDFIRYYEDVDTQTPVRWEFSEGITIHVITFEVGAVLEDSGEWQAPTYCFTHDDNHESHQRNRVRDDMDHPVDHSIRKLAQWLSE